MKKFLILYKSSASAMEQMAKSTPEQAKAGMEMWMAWAGKAGPAIVDLGAPVGNAHAVTSTSSAASENKVGGEDYDRAWPARAAATMW